MGKPHPLSRWGGPVHCQDGVAPSTVKNTIIELESYDKAEESGWQRRQLKPSQDGGSTEEIREANTPTELLRNVKTDNIVKEIIGGGY